MASKLGFSTGKGFIEKVDKAALADNATNATKVNNVEITRDANGVLKVGDIIIPQKKLLWNGLALTNPTDYIEIEIGNVSYGEKIEVLYTIDSINKVGIFTFMVQEENVVENCIATSGYTLISSGEVYLSYFAVAYNNKKLLIKGLLNGHGNANVYIEKIYKVIE